LPTGEKTCDELLEEIQRLRLSVGRCKLLIANLAHMAQGNTRGEIAARKIS